MRDEEEPKVVSAEFCIFSQYSEIFQNIINMTIFGMFSLITFVRLLICGDNDVNDIDDNYNDNDDMGDEMMLITQ